MIRLHVIRRHRFKGLQLRIQQSDVKLVYHLLCDLRLDGEYVRKLTIIAVSPHMGIIRHADQLGSDTNPALALFCVLFLIYYLFPMGVGGNGADPILFAVLGIVAGLWSRERRGHADAVAPVPRPDDEAP